MKILQKHCKYQFYSAFCLIMDNLKIVYFRENSNKKVPAINTAKLMKYNPSGL